MIVWPAAPLAPEEAARRAATGADPVWISSPGGARDRDVGIAFDVVAADPPATVRDRPPIEVQGAWDDARRAWASEGVPVLPEVPVGVGWLSYDLARAWTPIPARARDDQGWPTIEFRFFDAIWCRRTGEPTARIFARDARAARRLADRLENPAPALPRPVLGPLTADEPRHRHGEAVARIQDYLRAGDAYQVNLARRLAAPVSAGDPIWIAAALRARAPAPHALWMGSRSGGHDGAGAAPIDRYVVGNSPERFLRVDVNGNVETRPIKGTRPRGADAASDAAARAALAAAAKDRAEHVMIVDLERNDLGRVCQTGSVAVDGVLRVVELPTVFHLASTVRGRLLPGVGLDALVRATFPGGSVTGTPKRRAMEIIEELEPVRRGIYTGATGWLGAAGDLDLAVAIRTATVAGGRLSFSVGGGIVVDSDAADEWEETEVKARAFVALCDPDRG
ncbi:MAG: chorismate-binding protein [Pseudomonadota bacterium]